MAPRREVRTNNLHDPSSSRGQKWTRQVREPEPTFDSAQFVSEAAEKRFYEVIQHEKLTDSQFYDLESLGKVGLDVASKFREIEIAKMVTLRKLTYELLVKKFYANFSASSDDLGDTVVRSKVMGGEVNFEESDLANWFELANEGYKCKGSFQYKSDNAGSDNDSSSDVEEVEVLAKSDVRDYLASQAVIEIVGATTKFEQNDFGPVMGMVYGAITRNITPKNNTQHKMV